MVGLEVVVWDDLEWDSGSARGLFLVVFFGGHPPYLGNLQEDAGNRWSQKVTDEGHIPGSCVLSPEVACGFWDTYRDLILHTKNEKMANCKHMMLLGGEKAITAKVRWVEVFILKDA